MNLVSLSLRSALAMLMLGALAACGGGGGSSGGGNAAPQSLSGVVVDPAIAGASVTLRSSSGSALAAVVVTDQQGRFSFSVPASASLTGAVLSSRGGEDVETGYLFRNAVLSAPVTGERLVVSLLSTLVQQQVEEGASVESATQAVAGWFGLTPAEVLADPRESVAAQQVSLTLSGWLNALRDEETPITRIGAALRAANGDLVLARQTLSDDARAASTSDNFAHFDQLAAQFDASSAASAEEVVARFTRANLFVGITRHIDEYIGALNLADPVIAANIDALVDAIWEANGRRGVPQDSARVINLARYALTEGDISLADLADSAFSVPDLSGDRIKQIVAARDAIDHTLPLAPGEYLGMDNARRLAYFYASDLSPFYQAEQIFDGVTDDTVLDPLYKSIAQGQARAGLLDQALVTLETRIFQASARVDAMRTIGLRLSDAGRDDAAGQMIGQALAQVLRIIDAKGGEGFIDNAEVQMLTEILFGARRIGQTEVAEAALQPLYRFAQLNAGNGDVRTLYGRVIGALGNANGAGPVPEAVLAYESGAGSLAEAQELVSIYRTVIMGTPPQANGTETVKGLYLAVLADYEDRVGLDPWGTLDVFFALRQAGTSLDTHVRRLADIYGRHDRVDDYLALIETVSSTSQKNQARTAIAVWEAIRETEENGVEAAIQSVIADATELSAQMDRLLWVGRNQGGKGLMIRLLEKGEQALAEQVIDYTAELVASSAWQQIYADNAVQLGSMGCAKVAYAWHLSGDAQRGNSAMDECLQFIAEYDWSESVRKFNAYSHVGNYQLMEWGDRQRLGAIAQKMLESISGGTPGERQIMLNQVAGFAVRGGRDELVREAVDGMLETLPSLPLSTALSQEERLAQITMISGMAAVLISTNSLLREWIALDGALSSERYALQNDLLESTYGLLLQDGASLVSDVQQLNDPEARASWLSQVSALVARAGSADKAIEIANLIQYRPNRDAALGAVARAVVLRDDFPGSVFASRDTDADGRPDFFDPVTEAAGENPFELDDDIDGDGCRDDQDRRPFMATDGLADCAA